MIPRARLDDRFSGRIAIIDQTSTRRYRAAAALLDSWPRDFADRATSQLWDGVCTVGARYAMDDFERWAQTVPAPVSLRLDATDADVRLWAAERVAAVERETAGRDDVAALRVATEYARNHGVNPPEQKRGVTPAGVLARLKCRRWWSRVGRRDVMRSAEQAARSVGLVGGRRSPYVSRYTAKRHRSMQSRLVAWMAEAELANLDTGEYMPLEVAAAASVANPRLRRLELMVRIRGMEERCSNAGRVGLFVTLTAPSRFHSMLRAGQMNPRYRGESPRDAQHYLRRVWAKARAKLHRLGVSVCGLRVAEPHHDGCPHWHLLMWCQPADAETVRAVLRRYALADTPNETGARKHRCKIVDIDPAKGSATGYVAKYVAKCIDGHALQDATLTDAEGDFAAADPERVARRVAAWASCWGIRQFQFFGAAPVGIWRELRRLRDPHEDQLIEAARWAADQGTWNAYEAAVSSIWIHKIDGEPTQYDGIPAERVKGVNSPTGYAETRPWRWTIRSHPGAEGKREARAAWTRGNNCSGGRDLSKPRTDSNIRTGIFNKPPPEPDPRSPQTQPLGGAIH